MDNVEVVGVFNADVFRKTLEALVSRHFHVEATLKAPPTFVLRKATHNTALRIPRHSCFLLLRLCLPFLLFFVLKNIYNPPSVSFFRIISFLSVCIAYHAIDSP